MRGSAPILPVAVGVSMFLKGPQVTKACQLWRFNVHVVMRFCRALSHIESMYHKELQLRFHHRLNGLLNIFFIDQSCRLGSVVDIHEMTT